MQRENVTPGWGTSYDRWNRALAHWAAHGYSEGTPIYLSVDEQALLTVARNFAGLPCANFDEACDSFRQALLAQCVAGGEHRIALDSLGGTDNVGIWK